MPADPVGEAGGAGLGGGEAGDGVHGHGAPPPAGKWPDAAGDADGLGGVGEVQASHGGGLQAADLDPAVPAVAGWSETGTWRQGRVASWWCRVGWLALTIRTSAACLWVTSQSACA